MNTQQYTTEDAKYCLKMAIEYAGGRQDDIPNSMEAVAWWNVYCQIMQYIQPYGKFEQVVKSEQALPARH